MGAKPLSYSQSFSRSFFISSSFFPLRSAGLTHCNRTSPSPLPSLLSSSKCVPASPASSSPAIIAFRPLSLPPAPSPSLPLLDPKATSDGPVRQAKDFKHGGYCYLREKGTTTTATAGTTTVATTTEAPTTQENPKFALLDDMLKGTYAPTRVRQHLL